VDDKKIKQNKIKNRPDEHRGGYDFIIRAYRRIDPLALPLVKGEITTLLWITRQKRFSFGLFTAFDRINSNMLY
jgi:hypothetical protein